MSNHLAAQTEHDSSAHDPGEDLLSSSLLPSSLSPSELNPPSLNSPSVMLEPVREDDGVYQTLRFLQDTPFPYRRIALSLAASGAAVGVLIALLGDSRFYWLGIYVVLALLGALYFYQNSTYKLPVLILFPGKGFKSPQFERGVGWSLVDNVRLERDTKGGEWVVFQIRPGMPWPGKKPLFKSLPQDDPLEGRPLRLNLYGMSRQARQRMFRILRNHHQAYRATRG